MEAATFLCERDFGPTATATATAKTTNAMLHPAIELGDLKVPGVDDLDKVSSWGEPDYEEMA